MKALIVDDEFAARENLEMLLQRYCPSIVVAGKSASVAEAAHFLDASTVEILFLDISMPEESGFELLNRIDKKNYQVVFVTAYDEYSLKALKMNAVDYLLKPINIEELKTCEEKLNSNHYLRNSNAMQKEVYDESLSRLLEFNNRKEEINKIVVSHLQGYTIIDIDSIIYLEADTSYTIFHTQNNGKIVSSHNLKYYEDILDSGSFIRSHKSYLLNMLHFKQYKNTEGYLAVMDDGSEVPISRRKLEQFHSHVGKHSYSLKKK